ncbi:MAG TPA: hypothetical protein VMI31_06655, partial [Fimbriimonadaceae bacterium]|nr:hypothetical protein [Fimbriimonadaceae bacterium]
MRIPLTFLLIALAGVAFCQLSPELDCVVSGPKAYGMMDPELVAGSSAKNVQWSSDGRYLLAERDDIGSASKVQSLLDQQFKGGDPSEASLVVYSLASRKSTVVWREDPSMKAVISDVNWFAASDTAVATVEESPKVPETNRPSHVREIILLVDAAGASARTLLAIDEMPDGPAINASVSPAKPVGLLVSQQMVAGQGPQSRGAWQLQFRAMGPDGTLGPVARVPQNVFFAGWSEDGTSPVLRRSTRDANGKLVRENWILDLNTGAATPVDKPAFYSPKESAQVLSVVES